MAVTLINRQFFFSVSKQAPVHNLKTGTMKKVSMLLIVALLITTFLRAQTYIAGAMGYTHGSKTVTNLMTHQDQTLTSNFLLFSMNGGYKTNNNWLAEFGGTFNGAPIINLQAGRQFGNLQLMAGTGTVVDAKFNMKIEPQGTARICFGHLQFETRVMPHTFMIGVGVIGWKGEDF